MVSLTQSARNLASSELLLQRGVLIVLYFFGLRARVLRISTSACRSHCSTANLDASSAELDPDILANDGRGGVCSCLLALLGAESIEAKIIS